MHLTDILISIANIAGLLLCLAYIGIYFGYGNRLRKPAGRAFMILVFGATGLFIPLVLRHPGDVTTSVPWFAWLQVACGALFCTGMAYLISIGIRVNGKWPWE